MGTVGKIALKGMQIKELAIMTVFVLIASGCTSDSAREIGYARSLGAGFGQWERKSNEWLAANLDKVELIYCDDYFDDKCMRIVSRFHNLKRLSLMISNVTDDGLVHIQRLGKLRKISLYYSKVSDRGMQIIARQRSLRYVDLTGTSISDAGITHLHASFELESLDIADTNVTERGVRLLQHNLPNVSIDYE